MAHMMKTTEGLRKQRIQELQGTLAGEILQIIDENFDYDRFDLWGYIELNLPFTYEQKCLLQGWNALHFCSYTNTCGMNSLTIKNYNSLVRKVHRETMKELGREAFI